MGGLLLCMSHGYVQGYITCVHVMQGAGITHIHQPTRQPGPQGLGEALCAACAATLPDPPVDDLRLICSTCLQSLAARMN